MPERSVTPRRRTVLAGLGTAVVGSAFGPTTATGQESAEAAFVLEQGENCVPVTPLSGDQPVEDFFAWNQAETDYSSAGTSALQRPDTSILFLYEGPSGRRSLVLVHGALDAEAATDETAGGSVTMRFVDVPGRAEWIVRDDFYDDPSNYDRWRTDQRPQVIDWTWAGNRTDGGVLAPLGEEFAVTVEPAFNGAAALAGEHYDGQITDWQVLSGNSANPDRTSLALEEPVRIRSGACGGEAAIDAKAGPLEVSVNVVQGKVNPESEGVLPVDVTLPENVSAADVDLESISADPGDVTPVSTSGRDGGDGLRVFFPVGALDIPGGGSEPLVVTGETTDGRPLRGEDPMDLAPNAGGDDDNSDDDGLFDDDDLLDDDLFDDDDSEEGDEEPEDGDDEDDDGGRGRGRGRRRGRGGDDDDGRGRGRGRGGDDDDDGDDDDEGDDDDDDDNDDDDEDGLGIGSLPL